METAPPPWAICSNNELSSQSIFFTYIQSESLLFQLMTIVLILPPCTAIKLHLLSSLLKNNWQAAARCSRTGAQAGQVQFLQKKCTSPQPSWLPSAEPVPVYWSFLYWGLQNWTQYSRCHLKSLSQVQDFAFVLVEFQKASPTCLWQPCLPMYQLHPQVGIICQLDQGALHLLLQVTKVLHRTGPR